MTNSTFGGADRSARITQSDVEHFMSWEMAEGSEIYERIVDSIIADPNGEVAQWCEEARRRITSRIDSVFRDALHHVGDEET